MRAAFEPVVDLAAVFAQPVLHVDLVGLVAREGEVEAVQFAALERLLPFELIEEVAAAVRVAEEQPVAAACAGRARAPARTRGTARRQCPDRS